MGNCWLLLAIVFILYSKSTHLLCTAVFMSFLKINMANVKKKKNSPPDHFTGVKYLAGHSATFQSAMDTKKISKLYDIVMMGFIKNYMTAGTLSGITQKMLLLPLTMLKKQKTTKKK